MFTLIHLLLFVVFGSVTTLIQLTTAVSTENLTSITSSYKLNKEFQPLSRNDCLQFQTQEEKDKDIRHFLYNAESTELWKTFPAKEERIERKFQSLKSLLSSTVWGEEDCICCGKDCKETKEINAVDHPEIWGAIEDLRTVTSTASMEGKVAVTINNEHHGETIPYIIKECVHRSHNKLAKTLMDDAATIINADADSICSTVVLFGGYRSFFLSPISITVYVALGILSVIGRRYSK